MAEPLKSRLQRGEILVAPGVYDGLTATLAEQAGFEAVRFYKYKDPEAVLGRYDSHADRFDHDPAISHHVEASKPGSAANLDAFTSDA